MPAAMNSIRIAVSSILFCLAWPLAAHAQHSVPPSQGTNEMPVFALLSLIGDKLEIVIKRFQTGSNLNQNLRQQVPIDNPIFDSTANAAAGSAIKRALPKAELAVLNTRSSPLYERQRVLFDDQGDKLGVPEAILDAARAQGANRLLIALKRRDDANFQFSRSGTFADAGKLEGLGFFVDGTMETTSFDNNTGAKVAAGKGFIAPYVFVDIMLLDVATRKVLGKKAITASVMATTGRAGQDINEPWNAMSSADKVRHVNQLIEREVGNAALEIIAKQP
jgi:hypothetical protein